MATPIGCIEHIEPGRFGLAARYFGGGGLMKQSMVVSMR